MEPDVMPMHSSSPPLLDDDGEMEDEFGDFGGFSCSTFGFTDTTEPPSTLRQPSPTVEPATLPPDSSCNYPVEQSQPTSTVKSGFNKGQVDIEGQHCNAEPPLHLTNGYRERDHTSDHSGTHTASVVGACSPREETGFADFTAFTEQAVHPWCCGYSPVGGTEHWDGRERGTSLADSLGEQPCDSGQEIIMNSKIGSCCAAKENDCTKVEHCEQRDSAPIQPSQDYKPQEPATALAFPSEETYPGEEEQSKSEDSQRERRSSTSLNTNSSQTSELEERESEEGGEDGEDGEESVSHLPHTASLYESVSEDFASFCDIVSPEGPSEDFDPSLSSPAPQEDKTDWEDNSDEEEEEFGNPRHADSLVNQDIQQSEAEEGLHYFDHTESATQETSLSSNPSESKTYMEDDFADFKEGSFEHHRDQDRVQKVDVGEWGLGSLPPSDSFADFCSAPIERDGEGCWGEVRDQGAQTEGKAWAQFREEGSTKQTDGDTEEENRWRGDGVSTRDRCQGSLSCRVQRLLQATFPEVVVLAVEGEEEEVPSLGALLQSQDYHPEDGEEERPAQQQLWPRAQWGQWGTWWQHRDVRNAIGLQFQWGGSHTNGTLLRCLGIDTRNIVFTGLRKQPVVVPAFASSLGMLEPTKESVPAVGFPSHTAVTAQGPPGPQDSQDPSKNSMQEVLPSSLPNWSSSGLSNSQDGCSVLNLDCFGPVEESGSSSSSRSNSPPPGVDRELYELTVSKLETGASSSHLEDTFNRLMSSAEMTSTTLRKHPQIEDLSAEAGKVIYGLPDLSFMQAKVLMFPRILICKECSSPTLE